MFTLFDLQELCADEEKLRKFGEKNGFWTQSEAKCPKCDGEMGSEPVAHRGTGDAGERDVKSLYPVNRVHCLMGVTLRLSKCCTYFTYGHMRRDKLMRNAGIVQGYCCSMVAPTANLRDECRGLATGTPGWSEC